SAYVRLMCSKEPTNLRHRWSSLAKLRVEARSLLDLPEGRYFVRLLPPGDPSALLRGYCCHGRTPAFRDHRRQTGLPAGHTSGEMQIPQEKVDTALYTERLATTRSATGWCPDCAVSSRMSARCGR